ncbi:MULTISPECIES: hypothetical protein [Paenibacillus]|uniref:hypothetical protein n=1 Tax=Paenibacillus TaxID=44249 RepID=UPI00240D5836|nr:MULTISPECIES: hypothetical protein [Paenibacillus]MCI1777693.1 hypothetical protein [Paenibacillus lautus]WFB57632.1 hypothetical protein P0X86_27300 [Paenibacillus sp. BR1-192]
MSEPIQLDLFGDYEEMSDQPALNGMYYERATGKFVSFVCGRRYFEITYGQCLGDKEWKERIKKERAI